MPDNQPSALLEPRVRDDGAEHGRDTAGAEADEEAPEKLQLPQVGDRRRQGDADAGGAEEHQHHRSQAEALGHLAAQGRGDAVEQQADGDRQRDLRAAPAELAFQRPDQHARRRPHAGGAHDDEQRHAEHDPRVVHAPSLGNRHDSRRRPRQLSLSRSHAVENTGLESDSKPGISAGCLVRGERPSTSAAVVLPL